VNAGSGILQATFIAQSAFVTVFLLLALIRAGRSRSERATTRATTVARQVGPHLVAKVDAPASLHGVNVEVDVELEALASLEAERQRLTAALSNLRAAHIEEEASFRARRREALLELHEHRRLTAELVAVEPDLPHRVADLRLEVEHLEDRRGALGSEVRASVRTSAALRDRAAHVQREIASLRLDRDRLGQRLHTDSERLRDLAHRRTVLEAESSELTALLEMLQQLADQPQSLTYLSDGEFRSESRARGGDRSGSAAALAAEGRGTVFARARRMR